MTLAHVCFLVWTVLFAHEPVMFIGSFLFFIGFTLATPQYQNQMSLRVPIMVGFFLAGLVILGGVPGLVAGAGADAAGGLRHGRGYAADGI